MAASCYNPVSVVIHRQGELLLEIPQLRNTHLLVTPERWLCISDNTTPILAWHEFRPQRRAGLTAAVPCKLSFYQSQAASLINTLLIEIHAHFAGRSKPQKARVLPFKT